MAGWFLWLVFITIDFTGAVFRVLWKSWLGFGPAKTERTEMGNAKTEREKRRRRRRRDERDGTSVQATRDYRDRMMRALDRKESEYAAGREW